MPQFLKLGARNGWPMLGGDSKGAGALEYAILCSFLVLAIIVGASMFGEQLGEVYQNMVPVIKGFPT